LVLQNLNITHQLCNGARGVVVAFDETNNFYPRVRVRMSLSLSCFQLTISCIVFKASKMISNLFQFTNNIEETIEPFKWRIQIEGKDVAVILFSNTFSLTHSLSLSSFSFLDWNSDGNCVWNL
jgi:hypothetical protein